MTRSNTDGTWSLEANDLIPLIAIVAGAHAGVHYLLERYTTLGRLALYASTAALVWPPLWWLGSKLGLWGNEDTGFRWWPR